MKERKIEILQSIFEKLFKWISGEYDRSVQVEYPNSSTHEQKASIFEKETTCFLYSLGIHSILIKLYYIIQ